MLLLLQYSYEFCSSYSVSGCSTLQEFEGKGGIKSWRSGNRGFRVGDGGSGIENREGGGEVGFCFTDGVRFRRVMKLLVLLPRVIEVLEVEAKIMARGAWRRGRHVTIPLQGERLGPWRARLCSFHLIHQLLTAPALFYCLVLSRPVRFLFVWLRPTRSRPLLLCSMLNPSGLRRE